jgi:hypothetical protein
MKHYCCLWLLLGVLGFELVLVWWVTNAVEICQIIDTFGDSVTSVAVTKTDIIAGCVDGTVRTFDIRNGRYKSFTPIISCL